MNKPTSYLPRLAGLLLTMTVAVLSGCVKEDLEKQGAVDEDFYTLEDDEYGLGFAISLDKLDGVTTRAGLGHSNGYSRDGVEDFVDTENLYILFFNLEGIFLFDIKKPTAVPMGKAGATDEDNQWFIKIPVKAINPNLIRYIEDNPFKIAVLGNWTFLDDTNIGGNLGDGSSDKWDMFEFHQPLDAEGNLTYKEGKLTGDHISLLAHAQRDNVYKDTNKGGYNHLVYNTETGPHMGPYTEWVRNSYKNEAEAEAAIRANYDVAKNRLTSQNLGIDYLNMWRLWCFDGEPQFGSGSMWKSVNEAARASFNLSSADNWWNMDSEDDLYVHGAASWEDAGEKKGITVPSFDSSFDNERNSAGYGFPSNASYIHFTAKADGYLHVRYKSTGGAELKVHIGKYYYENPADQYQFTHNKNSRDESKLKAQYHEENGVRIFDEAFGDVPGEAVHVFIYSLAPETPVLDDDGEPVDPSITVYEIEYIESRHLYDVDRMGILPTRSYPIPMYGIQDFDAIGEYWQPGLLFNLSQFNNAMKEGYSYRNVSLLRSLARVEVILPKSIFKREPTHVFLRSMNRSARITPVDFFTPTDIIWNGFDMTKDSDIRRYNNYSSNLIEQDILKACSGGVDGEIENIMQYGPIYVGSNVNTEQTEYEQMTEYRRATSWPFGIWEQQWNWNWNRIGSDDSSDAPRSEYSVDWYDTYKPGQTRAHTGQTVPPYPHVLHPRISRSDYARFTKIDDPDNYHYLIYVPEKNITDADNPGNVADRPKIVHVEIRFNGGRDITNTDNQVENFDDNGAYRLYFTPGGQASSNDFTFEGRQSWDDYEYNWNIASQHWPIMRNHVYRFTVLGAPSYGGNNVIYQVCAPDQRYTGWFFN